MEIVSGRRWLSPGPVAADREALTLTCAVTPVENVVTSPVTVMKCGTTEAGDTAEGLYL